MDRAELSSVWCTKLPKNEQQIENTKLKLLCHHLSLLWSLGSISAAVPSVDSITLVIEVAIKGNYSVLLLRSGVVSFSVCVSFGYIVATTSKEEDLRHTQWQ